MKKILAMLVLASALFTGNLYAGELLVKDGDSIAFLGDSITSLGWGNDFGYVHLVMAALKAQNLKVTPYPAGVSGHKSTNMNARMERDVVSKKPVWMTLSCGVNDVWHGKNGVPLEQFKTEITSILDKADKAGIRVIVMTASMITEDQNAANNQKLIPYNEFLRKIAAERHYLLADVNADMQKIINDLVQNKKLKPGRLLTADGVHMNNDGQRMMASCLLRVMGMDDKTIAAVDKDVWRKLPNAVKFGNIGFSCDEADKLRDAAAKKNVPVYDFIRQAALNAAEGK